MRSVFDAYATKFDRHLTQRLEYQTPTLLRQELETVLDGKLDFQVAIDLGCGTGLSGQAFRSAARLLHGVDLSPRMIEEARKKHLYDELTVGGIEDFLSRSSTLLDLFIGADVFNDLGDLTNLFAG